MLLKLVAGKLKVFLIFYLSLKIPVWKLSDILSWKNKYLTRKSFSYIKATWNYFQIALVVFIPNAVYSILQRSLSIVIISNACRLIKENKTLHENTLIQYYTSDKNVQQGPKFICGSVSFDCMVNVRDRSTEVEIQPVHRYIS